MAGNGGTTSTILVGTVPVIVGGGLAGIGFLIRSAVASIKEKVDDLEASFTRVTTDLASHHATLAKHLEQVDKRLVRVESWKELVSLPDDMGRRRRLSDRVFNDDGGEEGGNVGRR